MPRRQSLALFSKFARHTERVFDTPPETFWWTTVYTYHALFHDKETSLRLENPADMLICLVNNRESNGDEMKGSIYDPKSPDYILKQCCDKR